MPLPSICTPPPFIAFPTVSSGWPMHAPAEPAVVIVVAAADPEDGDEEDLAVAQPAADEESTFDDFDDEFDDDFEEDEDDPDWDHPGEGDTDTPPPGKAPGRKK